MQVVSYSTTSTTFEVKIDEEMITRHLELVERTRVFGLRLKFNEHKGDAVELHGVSSILM